MGRNERHPYRLNWLSTSHPDAAMSSTFVYDAFLSYNSRDREQVQDLAERLRHRGLSVWFDEWIIQPGDDIYLSIERGLESSRTLLLCMSPAAFGSDWTRMERSTVLFRDPTNRERRFIPVLLSECTIPDTIRRHSYVDWRARDERNFERLILACRSSARGGLGSLDGTSTADPLVRVTLDPPVNENTIVGFLEAIGLSHSIGQPTDRYYRLPQLFVPPAEFPLIEKLLAEHNFVLLLGDPQIGKTYTAIYLLFKLYEQGYRPFWESVRDIEPTHTSAFQRMRRPVFDLDDYVQRRLGGKNAIYIEDPWGKIAFDMPAEFTASLEMLVRKMAKSDAKLIITSRSSIFDRLKEIIGQDFAVTMRAEMVYGGTHGSYGTGEKRQIYDNYRRIHSPDAPVPQEALAALEKLHSPNSIREFCHLTRHSQSAGEYLAAVRLSDDLDHQLAIEIIADARPYPVGRRHRAALALFLYILEYSRHFFRAFGSPIDEPRSFERIFAQICQNIGPVPLNPLQEALESLGDRVVLRRLEGIEVRPGAGNSYQFTHPVYLNGVARATADPEVRRLLRWVVLALGYESECEHCGYHGPFIHAYQFTCNELDPEGPVCPQCHEWGRVSYILLGVSLPYSLEPVYEMVGMFRTFSIRLGTERLRLPILDTHLIRWSVARLKELVLRHLIDICEFADGALSTDCFELQAAGSLLPDHSPLSEIEAEELFLSMRESAPMTLDELAKRIHDNTTDIDW